jgi:hypothetical protein
MCILALPFYFCDRSQDLEGDLRDDGVPEGPQSVHPVGYPISHSTHAGFKEPVRFRLPSANSILSASELFWSLPFAARVSGLRAPFQSRLVTVGYILAASVRLVPLCALLRGLPQRFPLFAESLSIGVGHIL